LIGAKSGEKKNTHVAVPTWEDASVGGNVYSGYINTEGEKWREEKREGYRSTTNSKREKGEGRRRKTAGRGGGFTLVFKRKENPVEKRVL